MCAASKIETKRRMDRKMRNLRSVAFKSYEYYLRQEVLAVFEEDGED
jgi:hypothetical protein